MTKTSTRLSLDERVEFARLAVRAGRSIDEDPGIVVRDLAATTLPWETETPSEYVVENPARRYSFTDEEKVALRAERKNLYPIDVRIGFARIYVTGARQLNQVPDEKALKLAATPLPWEDEAPSEYTLVPVPVSRPPRTTLRSRLRRSMARGPR